MYLIYYKDELVRKCFIYSKCAISKVKFYDESLLWLGSHDLPSVVVIWAFYKMSPKPDGPWLG